VSQEISHGLRRLTYHGGNDEDIIHRKALVECITRNKAYKNCTIGDNGAYDSHDPYIRVLGLVRALTNGSLDLGKD
jgi:hypothetical protein